MPHARAGIRRPLLVPLVQGGVSLFVGRIAVGVFLDEQLHRAQAAVLTCGEDGRAPVHVLGVDVDPVLEEHLHGVNLPDRSDAV